MNNVKRGAELARRLFAVPNEPGDRTQRIEFKGGKYPEAETNLGGYCESALAEWFTAELDRLDALGD